MAQPSNSIRLGAGAYLAFGSSAAYATDAVAADMDVGHYIDEAADNLQVERNVLEFADLFSQWPLKTTRKAGHRQVTGSVTLKATWSGLQDILRFLTGHNVAVSGTGPYTYAFVPADWSSNWWITNNRALTIEIFRGGSFANSVFYQGCEIQELSVKYESGAFVELTLNFIGRGYTIGAKSSQALNTDFICTPTGQSQSTDPFFQFNAGGGLTTYVTRSLTVTITTGIDFRRDVTGIEPLLPYPTEKWTTKVDAEFEIGDENLLTILDDPEGSSITEARVELDNNQSGANNRNLLWTFDDVKLESPAEARAASIGVMVASISGMAEAATAASQAFNVTLINGQNGYQIT